MANRFIDKLAGFSRLDEIDTDALAAATGDPMPVAARTDLIREGDRPGPVFVLLDGWAVRYKVLPSGTRQILAILMPGDWCDLLVGPFPAMDHSIQTITAACVATIGRAEMDGLMAEHPRVARAMYVAQLADEGMTRAWITSMGRRSSIERATHLMCELYVRANNFGIPSRPALALPLSQLLLADALGMTPVHLNRVLKELRLCGALTLQRGSATIVDPSKLIQIAGFDENYLHRKLRRAT